MRLRSLITIAALIAFMTAYAFAAMLVGINSRPRVGRAGLCKPCITSLRASSGFGRLRGWFAGASGRLGQGCHSGEPTSPVGSPQKIEQRRCADSSKNDEIWRKHWTLRLPFSGSPRALAARVHYAIEITVEKPCRLASEVRR